jgi:hypothetical protein
MELPDLRTERHIILEACRRSRREQYFYETMLQLSQLYRVFGYHGP